MLKKHCHYFRICSGKDEGYHLTRLRSDSCKNRKILSDTLLRYTGSYACWSPTSAATSDASKTSIVLYHKHHSSMVFRLSVLLRFLNGGCQFFLNASCAAISALG